MGTVLPSVHGRINNLDSHLQVPISRWGEVFGDAAARFGEQFAGIALFDATDEPELTAESVWTTEGTAAPGASTPAGRLAAMDVMGIERQLIFPQVVLAMPAWSDHPNAGAVLREYNDAVLGWTAAGQGRLRPTALLNLTTIEGAIAEAERVAAGGGRAVFIQDGVAPDRATDRVVRHTRDLRVLHRLPPPRRRHRPHRSHGGRHRAPRRRRRRGLLRPQRRAPAPRLSSASIERPTMPDARPDSPELSHTLREELLLSLRRWTVDGSVPLTHEFLRTGDPHTREAYHRIQENNPVAQRLLAERYLAPVPDMDALRAMEEGTLGRAFATHIDDNGLDVDKLRESAFIEAHARDGDDQGFLAERGFQLHDLVHVLTGYDTSPLGEVGVVSFTAAQTLSPYPTFIMTTRPLQMALYEPELLPFVMDTVAEGWIRGRQADMLVGVRWEDHWAEPLADLRERHNLVAS
jgi:ubiquinone biosynthesis protein Coq4